MENTHVVIEQENGFSDSVLFEGTKSECQEYMNSDYFSSEKESGYLPNAHIELRAGLKELSYFELKKLGL